MTTLSKRGLLQALVGLAAVSFTGFAQARTPSIAAIDAAGASDIGRAWLAIHPSDAATLRADLVPTDDSPVGRLKTRVHDDYRSGRLFVHKGWFLSETEARLCALISLI